MKTDFNREEIYILDNIKIYVKRKKIKNIYLKVKPENLRVELSVPINIEKTYIEKILKKKIGWIKGKIENHKNNDFLEKYNYEDNEEHYFLGKKYKLNIKIKNILIKDEKAYIKNDNFYILLSNKRKIVEKENIKKIIEDFYKIELYRIINNLVEIWKRKLNVEVKDIRIKKMKTRWGTCNICKKRIWFNLDIIRRDIEIIEFIVVHELAHIIEPSHNKDFYKILDFYLKDWKLREDRLNNKIDKNKKG